MSQYGTIYRLSWDTANEDQTITVNIYDTENLIDDSATPTVHTLSPTGRPLVTSIVNNNRSKYGIFSTQAKVEFHSTTNYNAWTFADSKDNRWYMVASNGTGGIIFKGFMVLTDMSRPFMPNPSVITLTFSDNLGLLKEKPLKTDADEVPTGKNRIADYLTWALAKTGLSLVLQVENNVRPGTGTTFIDFAAFNNTFSSIDFSTTLYPQFYENEQITIDDPGGLNDGATFTVTSNPDGTRIFVTPAPINEAPRTNFNIIDNCTGHLYDVVFLDAKTFEKEIGECEDCFTVIEKIIGRDAFLVQYNGKWVIMRPDDFDGNDHYIADFQTDGTWNGIYTQQLVTTDFGRGEDRHWVNALQLVEYERPYKFAKHTYKFEQPLEVPCNVDFDRGDVITVVSPTETHYEVSCWTLRRGRPGAYSSTTISPYITKIFDELGNIVEKYVYIPNASSASTWEYLESEAIPVLENDKFNLSFSWRLASTTGLAYKYIHFAHVVLFGYDGSYWFLGGEFSADDPSFEPGVSKAKWYNTSNFTANTAAGEIGIDFGLIDELEWQSFTWEAPQVPVDGDIYIWLHNFKQDSSSDYDKDIEYNDIRFEYFPTINGSYIRYIGEYSKSDRLDDGYSANVDEELYISDGPKPILKGAMFVNRGSRYQIQQVYFNAHTSANATPTDPSSFMRYEKLRMLADYNQYRRGIRYFTGDVYGLQSDFPHMVRPVYITESDPDSSFRIFLIIFFEQDWRSNISNYKLVETNHTDGKVYDDDFEFKYITNG